MLAMPDKGFRAKRDLKTTGTEVSYVPGASDRKRAVVRVNAVLGFASDPALAEQLHELGHAGRVEHLMLAQEDVHRRRLRASTDQETDGRRALPREQTLGDGAVLVLEEARAVVVRLAEEH